MKQERSMSTDALTSVRMRNIAQRDTKAERLLRSALHRLGFRFTLHDAKLAGTPDIVLPRWRTAVFVHGCFWHRHAGCKRTTTPATNVAFWEQKFRANVARDDRNERALRAQGWLVLTVWECEVLRGPEAAAARIRRLLVGRAT
jgi:DNA mismatch endonuclease, patch repair protein